MQIMTIKEISEALHMNNVVVQRRVKDLFPDLVKQGVETHLNSDQVTELLMELKRNPFASEEVQSAYTEGQVNALTERLKTDLSQVALTREHNTDQYYVQFAEVRSLLLEVKQMEQEKINFFYAHERAKLQQILKLAEKRFGFKKAPTLEDVDDLITLVLG